MNLKGTLKVIEPIKEVGKNGLKKREVVLTTDEQYPQDILMEFIGDKCALLDKYKKGDSVDISINIRGRMWTDPQGVDKYFNSIQGWRIQSAENAQAVESPAKQQPGGISEENQDDFPF